ncbi:MAG TPA: DUF3662 and FHA domain-containing protein [Chloroflexota bacterium]|nr:DUF3662 and FHA domain-containing protein [Chloroflexota bacterium]
MNPVARFESFVERLMERTLTRTPHSRLQPVEIGKRLARVMDSDQVVGTLGVRVPNIFDVELCPLDFAKFKSIQSSVTNELETYLSRLARDRLFVLASPPIVRLHGNADLRPGEIAVRAQMEDIGPVNNGRPVVPDGPTFQRTRAMPAIQPAAAPAPLRHASRLEGPDRSFRLEAGPISIGRSPDNDIVIDDRRVSRHHAELAQSNGRWVVQDLGSTNGTALNGRLTKQNPLHDGDRVSLGGFELIFRE